MPRFEAHLLGGGLVSCLGDGLDAALPALRAGTPGPFRVPEGYHIPAWPYHLAGARPSAAQLFDLLDRAVQQALAEAQLPEDARRRLALFVGSTCLDLPLHESAYAADAERGVAHIAIRGPSYGNLAVHLAERFGIAGPQYTVNTACSSSANALLHARLLLAEGRAEHALVVGVEAYNRLSVQGFGSLMLLSRRGYRPFDRDRDGLILGEAAGALVLGRARGASDPALIGGASACDPSSPTNSLPERMADVMRAALDDAGVAPDALLALKAHGTGTPSNDAAEGLGMRRLGARLPPCTSLKPYAGHTLGACGAVETLLLLAAWRAGFLPATPGFAHVDPAFGVAPVAQAQPLPARGAILCNFFGFGGNNTSLVIERA